jgi:hypothetical protein
MTQQGYEVIAATVKSPNPETHEWQVWHGGNIEAYCL